ncbi:hypothetical protein GQ43DRAFT_361731, partial [Delitschia confertaspora ATCC 74209]
YWFLSHCWEAQRPDFPIPSTTIERLEQFKGEITWTRMPKTLQNTINLVHRLKLRRLWINSLFIIQNDPIDWEYEAGRMASVYPTLLLPPHHRVTLPVDVTLEQKRG